MSLGKFDAAQTTVQDAIKRGLDSFGFRSELYVLAFLRHDEAEMARQVEAARRFPEGFRLLSTQAELAAYAGQLTRAKELITQFASDASSRMGLKGSAASAWNDLCAGLSALRGRQVGARRGAAFAGTRTQPLDHGECVVRDGDLP